MVHGDGNRKTGMTRTTMAVLCAGVAWLYALGAAEAVVLQATEDVTAGPPVAVETAAPAAVETPVLDEQNDPLEDLNRITSAFNRLLRGLIIDPIVDGYQAIMPDEVQEAISNLVSNLTEPLTAVSSLVQGDLDNATTATGRFLVNTTIGLGGIRDPATELGMEQRREDFGQALGAHGVPPGPHIVLPVFGPSNLRDAPGDILYGLLSPIPFAGQVAAGAVEYADHQEAIQALGDSVLDPYVVERNAYEQHRDYLVHNGQKVPLPTIAEIE